MSAFREPKKSMWSHKQRELWPSFMCLHTIEALGHPDVLLTNSTPYCIIISSKKIFDYTVVQPCMLNKQKNTNNISEIRTHLTIYTNALHLVVVCYGFVLVDLTHIHQGLLLHIEAETRWTPFRRRHFQMHFHELKCLNSD